MKVKYIIDEDFINYHTPSMFIGTISCGGKCCIEANMPLSICQNDGWRDCAPVELSDESICERYLNDQITSAIVFGGLEPFEQLGELIRLIGLLRTEYRCNDDVVIYTGYYPDEIGREIDSLRQFKNIIVKFGRFIPNSKHKYDDVLGVELSSENQYAERIS